MARLLQNAWPRMTALSANGGGDRRRAVPFARVAIIVAQLERSGSCLRESMMTVADTDKGLDAVAMFALPAAWRRIGWAFRQRRAPVPSHRVDLSVRGVRRGIFKRQCLLVIALTPCTWSAPAVAQQPPASVPETVLHLSVSGSVRAVPDQLAANLVAEGISPSPADAQRRVNTLMADGLKLAAATTGVAAQAVGYQVGPSDAGRTRWVAQQTMELRGGDGPALLELTSKLQQQGFAAASLDWQLSLAARRKAQDAATTEALKALREQAASAAATLGLHVAYLKEVTVQAGGVGPVRPMMALAARSGTPAPQATAAPEDVTVSVSAEVVLLP